MAGQKVVSCLFVLLAWAAVGCSASRVLHTSADDEPASASVHSVSPHRTLLQAQLPKRPTLPPKATPAPVSKTRPLQPPCAIPKDYFPLQTCTVSRDAQVK